MKHSVFPLVLCSCVLMLGGCAMLDTNRARLREEIKREILAELRQQRLITGARDTTAETETRARMRDELERELLAKLQRQVLELAREIASEMAQSHQMYWGPVGSAEGQMLLNDEGLEGCHVKLIQLIRPEGSGELFITYQEGREFLAVTDEEGWYLFEELPVGEYRIKWQLPGDTGWYRRLKDKPDLFVEEGETTTVPEIETNRPVASR